MRAEDLLNWMTYCHAPLSLFREEDDGPWIVADNSNDTVVGSGANAEEALFEAYVRLAPAPRRCTTNIVEPMLGECIACGAANGEACLKHLQK